MSKSEDDSYTCVPDFCFFEITSETGLNGVAGILGFGPPYAANGPSFFEAMVDNLGSYGMMPVASWHLADNPEESWVDFGGYDGSYATSEQNWMSITENSSWWQLPLNGSTYGDEDIWTGTSSFIVDTGTSLLTLTKSTYDKFK